MLRPLLAYLAAHPPVALALASAALAVLRGLWRLVSVPLYRRHPRLKPLVEATIALIPVADLGRAAAKVVEATTGVRLSAPAPDPRDARLAALAAEVQRLAALTAPAEVPHA